MKRVVFLIFLVALLPAISFAQELESVPASVHNPQTLADWLSDEFSFKMEYPDKWQSPGETIYSKKGDCEDFAILASSVLSRLGIANNFIIIKFKNLKLSHAICIWRDKGGSYSFISNQKLYRTRKSNIADAIGKFYPDWESAVLTDPSNKYARIIKR